MTKFFQLLVSGLSQGLIVGFFAFALAALHQSCRVINVAIGEFAMFGVLGTVWLSAHGVPLAPAIAICVAGAAIVAALYDWGVLAHAVRGTTGERSLYLFLITFALSLGLQGLGLRLFGRDVYALDEFVHGPSLQFGGVAIARQQILIAVVVTVLCVGTTMLTRHTLYGKALTACGVNERGAYFVGINPNSYRRLAFISTSVLAVLIGVLISPLVAFSYYSGFHLAMTGLLAASIAHLNDPVRAMLVGIGVGLLQSYVGGYVNGQYQSVVALVILTTYVLARPNVLAVR